MAVLEILPNLFFIQRGYLNANHFVYRDERPVLIDTGYLGDAEQTLRSLHALGVRPERTELIVSTHSHCDHIGANRRIQEASGCGVALHRVGRHFIERRDDWSTWWRYYGQAAEFFDCTRSLEDGDVLGVGPYEFEVIYTPGHAADGIVLYNRRERLLISSDTLWESDIPVITLRVEGSRALFDALTSLERLERLDVRMVCPGHGRPFTDLKAAVTRSRARLRSYLERPEDLGSDQVKRIIVYTVLMHPGIDAASFFAHLMGTAWFPETCDLFFGGDYQGAYDRAMAGLLGRGILRSERGGLKTSVDP
jgi:glyoxylase-like metal-dependent hydrolase (beta-lactamase superfamily II)